MNLIVTCARHMEEEAADELVGILDTMGDGASDITITSMSGILTARTALDPVSVSRGMRRMLADEPWAIRYCMRVIPVQETVRADVDAIADAAARMAHAIPRDATYRITVEKRNTDISGSSIIASVARNVENKVSLEHADMIVLVEILEGVAGISVLHGSDIFSAEKARREAN